MTPDETVDHAESASETETEERSPGIVLVFAAGKPAGRATTLTEPTLELGREHHPLLTEDPTISRVHARVSLASNEWTVEDLGSRNGSFLNGKPLGKQTVSARATHVLRLGGALFLLTPDVATGASSLVETADAVVLGPRLRASWDAIERAAKRGIALHLSGETGTGKELAARLYHRLAHSEKKPFVAVNCATIASGIAERLLFGAVRGAFTGAEYAPGFAESARGGTLFLDEVAELDLAVQSKLLRLVETHELYPVGSTEARRVEFTLCTASHRDLAEEADAGRFRSDLYYRIARSRVTLPPLRERKEEIPWLAHKALSLVDRRLTLGAGLLEECLLRSWPGNVRELISEIEEAAALAAERGETLVLREHLGDTHESQRAEPGTFSREELESALRANAGNVTATARALGIHRNQLRRRLVRENLDPKLFVL